MFDISCELSARQTIHINVKPYFLEINEMSRHHFQIFFSYFSQKIDSTFHVTVSLDQNSSICSQDIKQKLDVGVSQDP